MSPGDVSQTRCTLHPAAVAGWHCPHCARELCQACAAITGNRVVVCAECGTLAPVRLGPRAEVFPFRGVWRAALRPLGSPLAIGLTLLVATLAHFCFTFGKGVWVVGCLVTAGWVLHLARRGALGINPFAVPLWEDFALVARGPLLRFAGGAGVIGFGAMLWTRLGLVARPLDSPWPWLLAAGALVLIPPALVVASVEGPGRAVPWPWQAWRWLRALGAELRPLQLVLLIPVALELVESRLPPADRNLEDLKMLEHLFEAWLPRVFSFGALGALGALAGALVFTRAGQLGHRRPEDDLVPRVTDAPTGRYQPPPPDPEAEAREQARRYAPIALEESPEATAIDRDAREEAIAAYRAGALLAATLPLPQAVTLAQWLAGAGDPLAAANLLRVVTAKDGADDAALARALVVLARLCAERLDAAAEAARLYAEVARRFPDTPAARFAAEQLGPKP